MGKVVGVQIVFGDGFLGGGFVICIWGGIFINVSNELFFVIDGMFIDNEGFVGGCNLLNFFNLSDIEFFIVLKDVLVIVIYGLWGVNGVIIIIIKKGQVGSCLWVNYDGYYMVNEICGELAMFDVDNFWDVVIFFVFSCFNVLGDNNINWFDEMLCQVQGQNYFLSVFGGGQDFGYCIFVGYQ